MGSSWGGNDHEKSQNVYKNKGKSPGIGGKHRNDSYEKDPCVLYALAGLSIGIGVIWGAVQGFPT